MLTNVELSELLARLRRETLASAEALALEILEDVGHHCESPIEQLFVMAWELFGTLGQRGHDYWYQLRPQWDVTIAGQVYRLDFALWCTEMHPMADDPISLGNVAIELDGHDFHERTKEQVAYRNARDRALQAEGWKVFHFSGSEVWNRPKVCVDEVYDYCESEMGRLYIARREARKAIVEHQAR